MSFFHLETLTFGHPWALALLALLPVLAWLRGKQGSAPAIVFSSLRPLRAMGRPRKSRAGSLLLGFLLLALALLIIALARPRLGKTISHVEASGIDIMLALDVSSSMIAEDFTIGGERVNRLDAVKDVTEKFIKARPSDRIGIVAFAAHPFLVSPLTLDHDWLLQNLERVKLARIQDRNLEDGTAIGSAIASSSNRLKEREAKSKIVVLLTDGDNNAGKVPPLTAAEAAKALGIKVYTIGAGTRGKAPVPVYDRFGRKFYEQHDVTVDEETLTKIAKIADGQYFRATDSKSLAQIFNQIDKLEKSTIEMNHYTQYRDLFAWFLAFGLAVMTVDILLAQTLFRRLP
ncbi:MAG: Mg-chelatase subunit ChlD [Chthoniobacteraceae bacterium]|nr:Mg-chelatase subunit ChlD [Chthoniobacteraceae bacterium]